MKAELAQRDFGDDPSASADSCEEEQGALAAVETRYARDQLRLTGVFTARLDDRKRHWDALALQDLFDADRRNRFDAAVIASLRERGKRRGDDDGVGSADHLPVGRHDERGGKDGRCEGNEGNQNCSEVADGFHRILWADDSYSCLTPGHPAAQITFMV
ncbi:MAG: hypothetical protein JO231_19925 [Acidobacteria bacterium]|nr:hypothetical protein [Acidobacteriota bacterium]